MAAYYYRFVLRQTMTIFFQYFTDKYHIILIASDIQQLTCWLSIVPYGTGHRIKFVPSSTVHEIFKKHDNGS